MSTECKGKASDQRKLISQVLVAGLIAVAYSEPVKPVMAAFDHEGGVNVRTMAWFAIYFVTALRFFVGDIIHLENADLTKSEAAFRWFWDLSFIVLECLVLIFAGAVTSLHASGKAHVSFTDYLILLYAIDVVWILSTRLLDRIGKRWPRMELMVRASDKPPGEWLVISLSLGVLTLLLSVVGHPASISNWTLWILLGVNGAVFLYDLIRITSNLRDQSETEEQADARAKAVG